MRGRRRWIGPLLQIRYGPPVPLAAHRRQHGDAGRLSLAVAFDLIDRGLASKSAIGQDLLHWTGCRCDARQCRYQLLLVVGRLADPLAHDQPALHFEGSLRVVALFKAGLAACRHDPALRISKIVLVRARRGRRLRRTRLVRCFVCALLLCPGKGARFDLGASLL